MPIQAIEGFYLSKIQVSYVNPKLGTREAFLIFKSPEIDIEVIYKLTDQEFEQLQAGKLETIGKEGLADFLRNTLQFYNKLQLRQRFFKTFEGELSFIEL
jgi:hypothetical protein